MVKMELQRAATIFLGAASNNAWIKSDKSSRNQEKPKEPDIQYQIYQELKKINEVHVGNREDAVVKMEWDLLCGILDRGMFCVSLLFAFALALMVPIAELLSD